MYLNFIAFKLIAITLLTSKIIFLFSCEGTAFKLASTVQGSCIDIFDEKIHERQSKLSNKLTNIKPLKCYHNGTRQVEILAMAS